MSESLVYECVHAFLISSAPVAYLKGRLACGRYAVCNAINIACFVLCCLSWVTGDGVTERGASEMALLKDAGMMGGRMIVVVKQPGN